MEKIKEAIQNAMKIEENSNKELNEIFEKNSGKRKTKRETRTNKFRKLFSIKNDGTRNRLKTFFLGYKPTEGEQHIHKLKYLSIFKHGDKYEEIKPIPNVLVRIKDSIVKLWNKTMNEKVV